MGEEPVPVAGRAPRRDRHLLDPERVRLPGEEGAEVHSYMPLGGSPGELLGNLRTYFITLTTKTYTTMHYDL